MTIKVEPFRFRCRLDELPEGYYIKLGDNLWREASLSEVCVARRDGWPSVYRGGKMTDVEKVLTGEVALEGVPLV